MKAAFASLLACCAVATAAPNVIVIMADDMGYADVGFNGCKDIPTPHIDSLATNGVRFPEGYVTHPYCSPSRAGMLTGRYQQRFGHERNPKYEPANPKSGLPLSEILLPAALKPAGYTSAVIGKWHLGAHPQFHPNQRGFDLFFGHLGGGHQYFARDWKGDWEYVTPLEENGKPVTGLDPDTYLTDLLSDRAVTFIREKKSQPFFLYLAYNAPHTPLQAPERYLERFKTMADPKRRTYAAMVSALDDGVGRVLDALRTSGIEENTLIFFLSDNGGPESSNGSDNGPLRGGKGDTWEGGIRVPFAAQWKGRLKSGTVFTHPVISLDIFATALALAGGQATRPAALDGVDLMPYLDGKLSTPPHEVLYWRSIDSQRWGTRQGNLKLMTHGEQIQLSDLSVDPGESSDLSAKLAAQKAALQQLQDAWNAQLIAPVFTGLEQKKPKR